MNNFSICIGYLVFQIPFFFFFGPIQEMTDDLDHCTNTYHIYSKNAEDLPEVLHQSGIINWKQHSQTQVEGMLGAICGKEIGLVWAQPLGTKVGA